MDRILIALGVAAILGIAAMASVSVPAPKPVDPAPRAAQEVQAPQAGGPPQGGLCMPCVGPHQKFNGKIGYGYSTTPGIGF